MFQDAPWLRRPVIRPAVVDAGSNSDGGERPGPFLWSHVQSQQHLSGYYLNGPLSILKMRRNPAARPNALSSFHPWISAATKNCKARWEFSVWPWVCVFPPSLPPALQKCYLFKLATFQIQSPGCTQDMSPSQDSVAALPTRELKSLSWLCVCVGINITKGGKWSPWPFLRLFKTRRAVFVGCGVKNARSWKRCLAEGPPTQG